MNIWYLISKGSNPICRDAGRKFAESLNFKFIEINDNIKPSQCDLPDGIIVELGWVQNELQYQNLRHLCYQFLNETQVPIYARKVDDNHFIYNNTDILVRDLIKLYFKDKLISPYRHKYYGEFDPIVIPYHYDETQEVNLVPTYFKSRQKNAIFSGANDENVYPFRDYFYSHPVEALSTGIEFLKHPGYSGSHWHDKDIHMYDFVRELSNHMLMLVSNDIDDFELLKYIECAEAGCYPISKFPKFYIEDQIMKGFFESVHSRFPSDIIKKMKQIMAPEFNNDYLFQGAVLYRNYIKDTHNKELILKKYGELFG